MTRHPSRDGKKGVKYKSIDFEERFRFGMKLGESSVFRWYSSHKMVGKIIIEVYKDQGDKKKQQ